jgi:hypothetical protein
MATIYGSSPGVTITEQAGGIASIAVGREQKHVVFGRGDPANATAATNTPEPINTRLDTATKFGSGSELADGLQKALRNGSNIDYLYGVMADPTSVSGEAITTDADGYAELSNAPIAEDKSVLTVVDTSGTDPVTINDADVHFVYESLPTQPATADEVNVNPHTGEIAAEASTSYEVDYQHLDWQGALDAASPVINHAEVGIYTVLSEAGSVAETLSDTIDPLRQEFKMVQGVAGAQPNATSSAGEPIYDTATYTDTVDDDAVYLAAPVRRLTTDGPFTALGAIGGVFAGHKLTNPVYGDGLAGLEPLTQSLTSTERNDLRGVQVIPVDDSAGGGEGGIELADNLSTSTGGGWVRDFHRRRIGDQILLVGRRRGEQARSRRAVDEALDATEAAFTDDLIAFADADLIESDDQETAGGGGGSGDGGQEEQHFFVDVTRGDTDTVRIDYGFEPIEIIKDVDMTQTISENQFTTNSVSA